MVDDGLYDLFQTLSTPAADSEAAQSALQAALLAVNRIQLSNRREIYVKCLILCAKWCVCSGLQGNAQLLLEEAKEAEASCEMALMRINAEVALAAIQADSDGGKCSSAIRLLNKFRRSTKLIGY